MLLKGEEITKLLQDAREGKQAGAEKLMEAVYTDLKKVARRYMSAERANHTLQPTAILNEVFLRLFEAPSAPDKEWKSVAIDWQNRAHFLAVAARQMRRVLVEHGRAKKAMKRDGVSVSLDDANDAFHEPVNNYVELDRLLDLLATKDEKAAKVIELKYFGGLTDQETAEVLGMNLTEMRRNWEFARNWLRTKMKVVAKT